MKTFTLLLFILISFSASALEVSFTGPCSERPLLTEVIKFAPGLNAGEVSLHVLDRNRIPYKGTTAGLNQVFDTAIGLDAMETISDNEMLAYGWCFEIDGEVPEVFPDRIIVKRTMKSIKWFYGYAHFKDGEWIAQCVPSYKRKPKQFCE
jgi:hypothetical protein